MALNTNERFVVVDRYASSDPYPYHVIDNVTGERSCYTDFREIAQSEADSLNFNPPDYS